MAWVLKFMIFLIFLFKFFCFFQTEVTELAGTGVLPYSHFSQRMLSLHFDLAWDFKNVDTLKCHIYT